MVRGNHSSATELRVSEMLSHLLVAITIEHDNEWEMRFWLNHEPKPVRTSLVMWANFLRFVPDTAITVSELSLKAGYPPGKIHPDFAGMRRWGYIKTDSKNPKRPKPGDRITPSQTGRAAAEVWEPLAAEIEQRWKRRFGTKLISNLRLQLIDTLRTFDTPLPHYFPCLQHRQGMRASQPHAPDCDSIESLTLPSLLSQLHLLFTLEAERNSEISLAIRLNVLRVLSTTAISLRNLPMLSGISREAIVMSCNSLEKSGLATKVQAVSGRGKAVKLTDAGLQQQSQTAEVMAETEETFQQRITPEKFNQLKTTLEQLTGTLTEPNPKLAEALKPRHTDLWRHCTPKPFPLARHPMVLYRGGWPDGS